MTTTFQGLSNYEKLLKTADTLRFSQGYYGRLYNSLQGLDSNSINDINNIESLFNTKDIIDVVMYLEG